MVSGPSERRDPRSGGPTVGAGLRPSLMDLPPTEPADERKERLN